jgi:hypothetical protein
MVDSYAMPLAQDESDLESNFANKFNPPIRLSHTNISEVISPTMILQNRKHENRNLDASLTSEVDFKLNLRGNGEEGGISSVRSSEIHSEAKIENKIVADAQNRLGMARLAGPTTDYVIDLNL